VPTITSIKQQKNKNRVNVYLDDTFGFGIDLDNFALLNLRINQEYTQEEIEIIIKKAEFQKTYDKLLRFAMVRPRSEKEITDYFRRKKIHESMHEEMLKKLKHLDLINDLTFAKWWIDQRIEFKSKSKRIIIQELRMKGISQNDIDDAFGETVIDEEKMVKDLIERRAYKWKGLDPRVARQKMSQYLAGKGFSWDVIEKVI
jgi:regulatory protein